MICSLQDKNQMLQEISDKKPYGVELILDIHRCETIFNRESITDFMWRICSRLEMERHDLHFWDYDTPEEKEEAPPHLAGTSAIQFITTSNITIHTLDKLNKIFINIFTCSTLNKEATEFFCESYWKGIVVKSTLLERL